MKSQCALMISMFLAVLLSPAAAIGQSAPAAAIGQSAPAAAIGQSAPAVVVPDGSRFAASTRGQVYYPLSCEAWHELAPENVRFFASASEAEADGYALTEDRSCRPPGTLRLGEVGGRRGPICVVMQIVDGDTLDCRDGPRIRLLLVDTPETEQGQFGLRSTLALEELLPAGTKVAVETDVQERDRYGRTLAHLYRSDGTWVNRALVRRGYAVVLVLPPNVRGVEELRAAADSAEADGVGLWATGGFRCLPVDARAGRCGG